MVGVRIVSRVFAETIIHQHRQWHPDACNRYHQCAMLFHIFRRAFRTDYVPLSLPKNRRPVLDLERLVRRFAAFLAILSLNDRSTACTIPPTSSSLTTSTLHSYITIRTRLVRKKYFLRSSNLHSRPPSCASLSLSTTWPIVRKRMQSWQGTSSPVR